MTGSLLLVMILLSNSPLRSGKIIAAVYNRRLRYQQDENYGSVIFVTLPFMVTPFIARRGLRRATDVPTGEELQRRHFRDAPFYRDAALDKK